MFPTTQSNILVTYNSVTSSSTISWKIIVKVKHNTFKKKKKHAQFFTALEKDTDKIIKAK